MTIAKLTDCITGWCSATIPAGKGSVCVVLADDATLRDLNHQFRGKDKPTNVLSFAGEGDALGEIVLSYETLKAEAKAQAKPFANHLAHLVVHGCLHLLGYDHERESEAEAMEAKEKKILAGLGISDPYKSVA